MKVLVVTNMAPFVWGGAEELAVHLRRQLEMAGHEAEVLGIPFSWEPASLIPSQMLLARNLELRNVDRVIALKFPAYLVRHPERTLWLLHQYRQAYDLYDAGQTNIPAGAEGDALREMIRSADCAAFSGYRRLYCNSPVTQDRLKRYNGMDADVLLPPVNDPEIFADAGPGDYIFAGGRVNQLKRQKLLVEAMVHASPDVKLLIAGPPEFSADADQIRETIERCKLADRVKLDLRFLPRETYARYVREAAAVAYLPYDEDSLGYVAMEAATASKALLTTEDSGGILGLARHLETGWVTEPTPEALGRAMSEIAGSRDQAARLGRAAKAAWDDFGISWPKTIERLLG